MTQATNPAVITPAQAQQFEGVLIFPSFRLHVKGGQPEAIVIFFGDVDLVQVRAHQAKAESAVRGLYFQHDMHVRWTCNLTFDDRCISTGEISSFELKKEEVKLAAERIRGRKVVELCLYDAGDKHNMWLRHHGAEQEQKHPTLAQALMSAMQAIVEKEMERQPRDWGEAFNDAYERIFYGKGKTDAQIDADQAKPKREPLFSISIYVEPGHVAARIEERGDIFVGYNNVSGETLPEAVGKMLSRLIYRDRELNGSLNDWEQMVIQLPMDVRKRVRVSSNEDPSSTSPTIEPPKPEEIPF